MAEGLTAKYVLMYVTLTKPHFICLSCHMNMINHSLAPRLQGHFISDPGGRLAASDVAAVGVLRAQGSRGDVAEVLRGRAGVLL